MESFFKTLKYEEVYLYEYETYEEVMERIPYFIEAVYNQKRLHSGIGYLTPEEYERWLLSQSLKGEFLICSPKTGQKILRFLKMLKYLEKEPMHEEIAIYRRTNSFCA
jgi:hypothetical protein